MIWVMYYFGYIAYKSQYPQGIAGIDRFAKRRLSFGTLLVKRYYLIPIFFFCFFSAVRYKVGVDFGAYKRFFYEILVYGHVLDEDAVELGFTFLAKVTTLFTDTHYLLFFILAFLQISFIYYALRKRTYALVYLGTSIMLNYTYHSLMNGVRQNIVACAFVAMLPLILEKKRWPLFIACVFIATLMHKSALFLLPIGLLVYFILKRGILSIPIQLIIMTVCWFFMDKIDTTYIEILFRLGEQAGYSSDKADTYIVKELMGKSFGAWAYISYLVYTVIVLYSKKLLLFVKNDKLFIVMYNLFFISICVNLLFYNNFGIERLNLYLGIFQPIILSIMLFYTSRYQPHINKYLYWGIIFILSLRLLILFFTMGAIPDENTLYKFDFLY